MLLFTIIGCYRDYLVGVVNVRHLSVGTVKSIKFLYSVCPLDGQFLEGMNFGTIMGVSIL